jgi:hypothetical protein
LYALGFGYLGLENELVIIDIILDDNMFCESVIDRWIKSGGML